MAQFDRVDVRQAGPAVEPSAVFDRSAAEVVRIAARAFERDRYLAALLAPADVRCDLLAIAAFAGDVARIPATVSEPTIGAIRLQWWRDSVEAAARDPAIVSGHPIVDALAAAIHRHGLAVDSVLGFIDAQDLGLGADPPADELVFAEHLAKTEGALFELAVHVLGGASAVDRWRPVVAPAAMAYGVTRLMVELPAHTSEGRTLIPATRMADVGINADALYARDGAGDIALQRICQRFRADVGRHLADVRRLWPTRTSARERVALLPLATVPPMLTALNAAADRPLTHAVDISPLTRITRVAWTYATARL